MIALIPEYIPIDILIGLGVGILGGILCVVLVRLRFNRFSPGYMDLLSFTIFILVFMLPVFYLSTMFLTFSITFLVVWLLLPVILGLGKRKPDQIKVAQVEKIVDVLSPEGRANVLEEMHIFQ